MLKKQRIKLLPVLILFLILVHWNIPHTFATGGGPEMANCDTPPDFINVNLVHYLSDWNLSRSTVVYVPFEDYILGVLKPELGQAWDSDVIRSMAIASRTWGTFECERRDLGYYANGVPRKGVENSPNDQVYRPLHPGFSSALSNHYENIIRSVEGLYVSYEGVNFWDGNYQGEVLHAQYRASVGNPSGSWYPSYDHLRSVNNPFDSTSPNSLNVGWPQIASQSWANLSPIGASWYQTLMHYYTGAQTNNKQPAIFADYWNNINCSGSPTLANQVTHSINYDWGTGSPAPGINADHFCVKWYLNNYDFGDQDEYTFYIMADDGFRLYIDGVLVLDKWIDQSPTLYSVTAMDMSGVHNVRLEYFENGGGAVARMSWQPGTGMIGRYYNDIPKTGALPSNPVLYRADSEIRFHWDNSSPLDTREGPERIYEDTFGIQWEGHVYLTSCRSYWVRSWSDDGIFVRAHTGTGWHNLIDNWTNHAPTLDGSIFYACAGTYPVEARYYDNTVFSVVNINWVHIPPLR